MRTRLKKKDTIRNSSAMSVTLRTSLNSIEWAWERVIPMHLDTAKTIPPPSPRCETDDLLRRNKVVVTDIKLLKRYLKSLERYEGHVVYDVETSGLDAFKGDKIIGHSF